MLRTTSPVLRPTFSAGSPGQILPSRSRSMGRTPRSAAWYFSIRSGVKRSVWAAPSRTSTTSISRPAASIIAFS